MIETANPLIRDLTRACVLTRSIDDLPAVATQDWCNRAAEAVSTVLQPGLACLMVLTVRTDGTVGSIEATGVAGRTDPPAGGTGAGGSASLIESTDARLITLRSRADRLTQLGWAPREQTLRVGLCGLASALIPAREWDRTAVMRLWRDLSSCEPIFAMVPLGNAEPGRCVMVQLASLTPAPPTIRDAAVLCSALPMLIERTLVAIGPTQAGTGRWLTTREQTVLEQLTLGRSVREIAEALDRSPHTIHDHVKSLHKKLDATNRGALIARALGHRAPASQIEAKPVALPVLVAPRIGDEDTGA